MASLNKGICFVHLVKDGCAKSDECSEKNQTAFDPPPHFRKMMLQFAILILPLEPLVPVEAAWCQLGMTEPWTLSDVLWTIAFTMV